MPTPSRGHRFPACIPIFRPVIVISLAACLLTRNPERQVVHHPVEKLLPIRGWLRAVTLRMMGSEVVTRLGCLIMSRFLTCTVTLALIGFGLTPGSACAHKMEVQATLKSATEGQPTRIEVEAWYEFDDSASGKAILTGPDGQELATAELDAEKGTCTFPLTHPRPGTYKITVDDGAGHREWVILTLADDHPAVVSVQSVRRNRWLMGAIGLGIIAVLTIVWSARRSRSAKSSPA